MVKKGETSNFIFFFILIISILITTLTLGTNFVAGQQCDPMTDRSICGQLISETGQGAVEMCGTCFECGYADGVCPEEFTNGLLETDKNKTRMLLRVGSDRPTLLDPNADPVIFSTGNEACEILNASCTGLETKNALTASWIASGVNCFQPMAAQTDYFRAVCNAQKTAGCQYCPDPDCITNVRGITYNKETDEPISVHVNFVSTTNTNIRAQTTSSEVYSMQAPRGNVKIVCTAEDYYPSERNVFLQKKDNVVDCDLQQASCSPECTLPNLYGQEICSTSCDQQNGCSYASPTTQSLCDGVPLGATLILNRTADSDYVEAVTCCEGIITQIYRPRINIVSNNIPDLLTRDYRKKLNGIPVNLRIITYRTN